MENPTSDEKALAAFAHASVILSFFGPIVPTLIWVYQREKSKYVRFHALQAMGYQTFLFWGWFIGMFVVMFGGSFLMILLLSIFEQSSPDSAAFIPFLVQPIIVLLIFGMWGLFFLGGFIGAFFCITGREFKYPVIGGWLSTRAFSDQTVESEGTDWEDNWVSGVCHAMAIIQMWGVIIPLIVWFSQKERSVKMRFQALQALIYQLLATVAYIVAMFGYMLAFFLLLFGAMTFGTAGGANDGEVSTAFGIFLAICVSAILLVWFLIMIAMPVYYLLAAVAGVMTVRGRNFKYPILGNILFKRVNFPQAKEQLPGEAG